MPVARAVVVTLRLAALRRLRPVLVLESLLLSRSTSPPDGSGNAMLPVTPTEVWLSLTPCCTVTVKVSLPPDGKLVTSTLPSGPAVLEGHVAPPVPEQLRVKAPAAASLRAMLRRAPLAASGPSFSKTTWYCAAQPGV